jgi:hypothetical protein
MKWLNSILNFGASAGRAIGGVEQAIGGAYSSLFKYMSAGFHGFLYMFTHPLSSLENAAAFWSGVLTGNMTAAQNAFLRLIGYAPKQWVQPVAQRLQYQINRVYTWAYAWIKYLRWYINKQIADLRAWVMDLIRDERVARRKADDRVEHKAHELTRWALAVVQKEAASGYRLGTPDRVSLISKLADVIATRNPVVKDLVGTVVKGAIDLAEVDNPLLRIGVGFVLKEIINRLGADKAMGHLLSDLMGPLLGQSPPRNLHDVIWSIATRLNGLEGQWAQFMQDGGQQVENAGKQWASLSGVAGDAAVLAFLAAMAADPQGWASDVSTVAGPIVGGAVDAISALMRF